MRILFIAIIFFKKWLFTLTHWESSERCFFCIRIILYEKHIIRSTSFDRPNVKNRHNIIFTLIRTQIHKYAIIRYSAVAIIISRNGIVRIPHTCTSDKIIISSSSDKDVSKLFYLFPYANDGHRAHYIILLLLLLLLQCVYRYRLS